MRKRTPLRYAVGDKTNVDSPVDHAAISNSRLYGVKAQDVRDEDREAGISSGVGLRWNGGGSNSARQCIVLTSPQQKCRPRLRHAGHHGSCMLGVIMRESGRTKHSCARFHMLMGVSLLLP